MSEQKIFTLKNRTKSLQNNFIDILNSSNIKKPKKNLSISINNLNNFSNNNNFPTPINNSSKVFKESYMKNSKINLGYYPKSTKLGLNKHIFKNRNSVYNVKPKRYSMANIKTKSQKLFNENNLKLNDSNIHLNNSNNPSLNAIENNIRNAINNILVRFGRKKKSLLNKTLAPKKFIPKIRKKIEEKRVRASLANLNINPDGIIYAHKNNFNKKRHKSFDYNEDLKKKIFKNIREKILKEDISIINQNSLEINSSSNSDINISSKNISLDPNSKFIFIIDLLLIVSTLYSFIFIPLQIAKNKNIREKESSIKGIIFFVDLIFIFDFIISLFKGYYDYEMIIIRNNKKILLHYLKTFFIFDLLEAIPLFTIIRLVMKSRDKIDLYYSDIKIGIIIILFFIKPLKAFKIIKKKHNKALEDFYSCLSENFYLEKLVKFLIYLLIIFLFIHLFICLHIYFALKSFPNWLVKINVMNESFLANYITSLYFMMTTMTTVGYGDIVCISPIERIYHIILLVIGTLLYTFVVSKIGNYLREQSHEQSRLNRDMNILETIRITYPTMTYKLYYKIKRHLLSIFNKRKKTGISILINGVPETIKKDLLFKIYSNVINRFTIFKNVNNSNFILQILTSFIPILSKKDEIIIREGEIINNIVFVRDGRLSMEISVNINEPISSIQKYIEINFIGISRREELRNYNTLNKGNTSMSFINQNYNDLKNKINNLLLDKERISLINNSNMDDNRISIDLGRMDFSRNINEKKDENIHIIKILDIRKNEYYGDIHLFLEQHSPFSLKTRSRIAELLLLRKYDAILLSKTFPNIWRRIQSKSYHNLVAIKNLTFKTLKQYYNTYLYSKNKKENNIVLNLDMTGNSIMNENKQSKILRNSLVFNKNQSFTNKIKGRNIQNNSISNFKYLLKNTKTTDNCKRNKLVEVFTQSTNNKNKKEESSKNRHFSGDTISLNSDSLDNYSLNNTKIINQEEYETKIQNKKSNHNFSFKNNIDNINYTLSSQIKILDINKTKPELKKFSDTKIINQSSQNISSNDISKKHITNESLDYDKNNENTNKLIESDSSRNFITLDKINNNFSKKIKNKIKKRKKIQKLRQFLKLQRFKIDKNLGESYLRKNSNKNCNSNIIINNNLNYSSSSSTFKILTKILNSSSSGIEKSNISKNDVSFNNNFLKKQTTEMFEIKASYNNINSLSKGEMIKNQHFKIFMENLIKKNLNDISKGNNYKKILSLISEQSKKEKKKEKLMLNFTEEEINKNAIIFSDIKLPLISNEHNLPLKEKNSLSNKKNNLKEQKENIVKSSSKLENKLKKYEKLKINNIDFDLKKNSDINIGKENLNGKKIYHNSKNTINKEPKNYANNKIISNCLDKLDEYSKDNNSRNEKILLFGDKTNDISEVKMINNMNNQDKEKNKNCYIY